MNTEPTYPISGAFLRRPLKGNPSGFRDFTGYFFRGRGALGSDLVTTCGRALAITSLDCPLEEGVVLRLKAEHCKEVKAKESYRLVTPKGPEGQAILEEAGGKRLPLSCGKEDLPNLDNIAPQAQAPEEGAGEVTLSAALLASVISQVSGGLAPKAGLRLRLPKKEGGPVAFTYRLVAPGGDPDSTGSTCGLIMPLVRSGGFKDSPAAPWGEA